MTIGIFGLGERGDGSRPKSMTQSGHRYAARMINSGFGFTWLFRTGQSISDLAAVVISLTALLVSLSPSAALGQDTAPPLDPMSRPSVDDAPRLDPGPPAAIRWSFRPRATIFGESDLEGGGDVSTQRVGVELVGDWAVQRDFRLTARIEIEHSDYEWNNFGALVPGGLPAGSDPGQRYWSSEFSLTGLWIIDERWGMVGSIGVGTNVADGASLGDGLTFGGLVAARYQVNPKVAVTGGFFVREQLEDDLLILPSIGVNWSISDRWTLGVGARGLDAELSYVSGDWRFFVNAYVEARDYRLSDTSVISGGVLRDWRLPVTIGAVWNPRPGVEVELFGGVALSQSLTLDNTNGQEIFDVSAEGGLPTVVGLRARIQF